MLAGVLLSAYPATRLPAQDTTAGKNVYVKWCAGCHGETGAGDGPAASTMLPRPRNFTGAVYKVRTTGSGQLPTDADLMRAIDEDRKSTRLNSSHGYISYAVFCLKKKKNTSSLRWQPHQSER